jgi:hypothetical protein
MIDPMGIEHNEIIDPDVLRAVRDNRLVVMNGDFSVVDGIICVKEVGREGPVYGIMKNCIFRRAT